MAILCPSWRGARVNQLGRLRGAEKQQPCASPTASQRSVGCDPNHPRQRVIPIPALSDSGQVAAALLPLLALLHTWAL